MSEDQEIPGEEVYQAAADENVDQSHSEPQERTVPLNALESERAKRQRLEEENLLMRENLELLKANQNRNTPNARNEQNELDGLDDDDILTVKQFKKLSEKMSSQFKTTINEMQVAQKYPDYQETITKYLPEIIKSNPSLKETLQRTQDYELAYYLAKNSEGYRNSQYTQKRNADAERILKNSEQSSGLSSVGASTPVSQAKRYKDMNDDDFVKLMQRNRM